MPMDFCWNGHWVGRQRSTRPLRSIQLTSLATSGNGKGGKKINRYLQHCYSNTLHDRKHLDLCRFTSRVHCAVTVHFGTSMWSITLFQLGVQCTMSLVSQTLDAPDIETWSIHNKVSIAVLDWHVRKMEKK